MRYIIMCGGQYTEWETPRHLLKLKGEEIVARTIRLLREIGIEDISISSDNPAFEKFGVPVLKHDNNYNARGYNDFDGYWTDAFYPTDEPTCYIFGDVLFSPEALRKIAEAETDDIELFGSAPPYAENYPKPWQEPFCFKVNDTDHFKRAIEDCKRYAEQGLFWRKPIAWELWATIKNGELKKTPDVYEKNYTVINDYTCDIDYKSDIEVIERMMNEQA